MCTHTRHQVEHQRYRRTGRVKKIQKILRKNTIFNEHPVHQLFYEQGFPGMWECVSHRVDVVDSPSFIFPFYSVYASHKENIITLLESIKLLNILIEINYA